LNNVIVFAASLLLLSGCKNNAAQQAEIVQKDTTFDRLLWQQYHCPDDEDEYVYKWNWAYEVRDSLGIEDLDSLAQLSYQFESDYEARFGGVTSDMVIGADAYAGAARFRMLNVYQALAELMYDTPLGAEANCYFEDFVLWEKVFVEYANNCDNEGSIRFIELPMYYKELADMRTEVLEEELKCLSNSGVDSISKAIKKEPKWNGADRAIRKWYDYRMSMADKLQKVDSRKGQCLREYTLKQIRSFKSNSYNNANT